MTKKSGNHVARGLVNMVDGEEHHSLAPTTSVELSKTHEVAHCRGETPRPSDSLLLDIFVQLLFLICLVGDNISLNLSSRCLLKAHNTFFG